MKLTAQQRAALERLHESESLTDNLTDADAQALLEWAQQQIIADTDDDLVRAAVNAANTSGAQGAQILLMQANATLAQELAARAMNADNKPNATAAPDNVEPNSAPESSVKSNPPATRLEATGEVGAVIAQPLPAARAQAALSPAPPAAAATSSTRGKAKPRARKKSP
jgi:DNA primase